MRFATFVEDGRSSVGLIRDRNLLPLAIADSGLDSVRNIAASGAGGLRRVRDWARGEPERAYRSMDDIELAPVVPDPGAIYSIGLNYALPGEGGDAGPQRPLVYAKLPTSVTGHDAVVTWDRSLTANVDAESELGIVIGEEALAV